MKMLKDKLKRIFTNTRVIILLVVILLGIIAINPQPNASGVAIRNVAKDSPAYLAGIVSGVANAAPTSRERITSVNSVKITSIEQYYQLIQLVPENTSLLLTTNKKTYSILKGHADDIGITVYAAPKSNVRLGLDLQGGTRVILQPEEKLSAEQLDSLITSMTQRLNVYGLSDISVRSSTDLSGNQFVVVEIAGANEEEVKQLLSQQGKFEARIGNQTVFKGGNNDITYVCKTAECSGIDSSKGCGKTSDGKYACRFRFSISLSAEAAQRQADITNRLSIVQGTGSDTSDQYLNETMDLLLDDVSVETLNIGASLKGKASTEIEISGSGSGATQSDAITASLANMKQLQTVLITGSLPVKINIVKSDTVSPTLGEAFTKNALFVSFIALLVVAIIIFIRYKRWEIILPMLIIAWIEIFLTIALAALIGWNLDVASIAGIIIAIGQGVNDQIIITDETLKGNKDEVETSYSWKKKLAKAFFIVFAAYFTSMGAMVTLLFAGAGLLRGFAITSIIGYTVGVLITRPAYSHIIEVLVSD
jgi:preprotein translocase subunit SecD